VHVAETVDPQQPIKEKRRPADHFITRCSPPKRPDEMAGLTEVLRTEQSTMRYTPGDVHRCRLRHRAHLNASGTKRLELLGPTRPNPHKGRTIPMLEVDVDKRQAICPQGKLNTQCKPYQRQLSGTEYYPD